MTYIKKNLKVFGEKWLKMQRYTELFGSNKIIFAETI